VRATRLRHAPKVAHSRAGPAGRQGPCRILTRVNRRAPDPAGDPEAGRSPWPAILIVLAGVAVLSALVLAIEPLRSGFADAVSADTASLREDLGGPGGALVVLALALVHSVVWYPTEILSTATGYVYGFWVALPLLMAGWSLNALVAYWIGRSAARPLLWRWLGRERLERYEGLVSSGGVTLLLAMRLVPIVPFSFFSYAAGSARVPLWRFMWTSFAGYVPLTAVCAYVGSRLEELSLTDPLLWAGALVLVGLLLLTRRLGRSLGIGDPA
jgi:uncharacterized membrane protein YdjX (TVP38/TMEM64 family)